MTESFATGVNDPSATAEARRRATSLAVKLGFDEPDVGRVALVVTELATNLLKHAGGGEILVRSLGNGEGTGDGAGVEILALDRGPGIADREAAFRDGYSSSGSPGTGLGAIRRAASEFDVYSGRATGTALVAVLRARSRASSSGQPALRVTGISIAKTGEEVCGDAWAVREDPEGLRLILVVDGLGHGPGAFDVAREACRLFRDDPALGPAEMMERLHRGLRPTRGAAAAVAAIDPGRANLVYAGVGNIAGQVLGGDRPRALVSHHGILGHEARKIQEFTYPWPEGATLVLQSDGLTSRWDLESYRGLMRHHPAVIAGILYRDFKRPHDDITVVVARPWTA